MAIRRGSSTPSAIYRGATAVQKVMRGTVEVWSAGPALVPEYWYRFQPGAMLTNSGTASGGALTLQSGSMTPLGQGFDGRTAHVSMDPGNNWSNGFTYAVTGQIIDTSVASYFLGRNASTPMIWLNRVSTGAFRGNWGPGLFTLSSPPSLTRTERTHYVVHDDGSTRTIYINGQLSHTNSAQAGSAYAGVVHIAANPSGSTLAGEVANAAVWNRPLTVSEMTTLHSQMAAGWQ